MTFCLHFLICIKASVQSCWILIFLVNPRSCKDSSAWILALSNFICHFLKCIQVNQGQFVHSKLISSLNVNCSSKYNI